MLLHVVAASHFRGSACGQDSLVQLELSALDEAEAELTDDDCAAEDTALAPKSTEVSTEEYLERRASRVLARCKFVSQANIMPPGNHLPRTASVAMSPSDAVAGLGALGRQSTV